MEKQIIKFDEKNFNNVDTSENTTLFVRKSPEIKDPNAEILIEFFNRAVLIKNGSPKYLDSNGSYPIFETKEEKKNYKNIIVDIIYLPKTFQHKIQWGTDKPINYKDPKLNIKVGAYGTAKVTIENIRTFYEQHIGNKKTFSIDEFNKEILNSLRVEFSNQFLKQVNQNFYYNFQELYKKISDEMEKVLQPSILNDYGVNLKKIEVQGINVVPGTNDEEDEFIEKLKNIKDINVNTVFCPNCGSKNNVDDKFCSKCGKPLNRVCPSCGKTVNSDDKFCSNCGYKFEEENK